jgi:predicted RNase H-like nuclease (RuvC/YqgF family)
MFKTFPKLAPKSENGIRESPSLAVEWIRKNWHFSMADFHSEKWRCRKSRSPPELRSLSANSARINELAGQNQALKRTVQRLSGELQGFRSELSALQARLSRVEAVPAAVVRDLRRFSCG